MYMYICTCFGRDNRYQSIDTIMNATPQLNTPPIHSLGYSVTHLFGWYVQRMFSNASVAQSRAAILFDVL